MGKRFIDTGIIKKKWFRKLTLEGRMLWLYIFTQADGAGVCDADIEMVEFVTGAGNGELEDALKELLDADQVFTMYDGRKWAITDFIQFQAGRVLSPRCGAHKPIQTLVDKYSSDENFRRVYIDYIKGTGTLKEKDKEEEKEKDKEEEVSAPVLPKARKKVYSLAFEEFWKVYPDKVGKGKAYEKWQKHKCDGLLVEILAGVEKYKDSQKWADGFIPLPATWIHQRRWEDTPPPKKSTWKK